MLRGRGKSCFSRFKHYIREPWNIFDQTVYILLLVSVILRFALTSDSDFVYARYVYTVVLVISYLRILQLYYFHKRLGPKVILIGRMVCVITRCEVASALLTATG